MPVVKTTTTASFSAMSGTEQEAAVLRFFALCGRGGLNPQWKVAAREGAANSLKSAARDRETGREAARLGFPLLVKASADQAELPTIRQVTREANEPQCPVYSNCEVVGTAPRSEAEETLARIWAAVLRVKQVGIHDNFFAVGGDSILGIQIVSRARQAGLKITPAANSDADFTLQVTATSTPQRIATSFRMKETASSFMMF